MNVPAVKGWCPGVLRPMESGDGLIVRLKITGGIVPLGLAVKIADWSQEWGNGQIDLTGRANLQLRGITSENLPDLQDAIAAAGLLDSDPEGEAVRNVIASPLAGLDPDAVLDIRPIVAALEARLTGDPALHKLPAKFCFAVDDGGRIGLRSVRADIRFEALATQDGPTFEIYFDGNETRREGSCSPDDVAKAAGFVTSFFLVHRERSERDIPRMRDLVTSRRSSKSSNRNGCTTKNRAQAPQPDQSAALLGIHSLSKHAPPSQVNSLAYLGVGLSFGRIPALDLADLANLAVRYGASELRLTPWRAVLVPMPTTESARGLASVLADSSFILDPLDPRRRVAACVGAPACVNATTDVRGDATRLAPQVVPGTFLHVSGCTKGCAHPRAAPFTLTGRDGRYDLVHNGSSSDSPSLTGLTLDEAARHLRQITADQTQGGTA